MSLLSISETNDIESDGVSLLDPLFHFSEFPKGGKDSSSQRMSRNLRTQITLRTGTLGSLLVSRHGHLCPSGLGLHWGRVDIPGSA